MNDEMLPPEPAQESQITSNPDESQLISEMHKLAGQGSLKELLKTGLIKTPDGAHDETAATLLAYPDFGKKKSTDTLKTVASQKLSKKLNKLLEGLGSLPPISDQKGADKLLAKTHILLMKAPGFSRLKADDKQRVVHKILSLAGEGDTEDLHEIIEHEANHSKAKGNVEAKVAALLDGTHHKEEPVGNDEREGVKKYVEDSGILDQFDGKPEPPQQYAEGGEVKGQETEKKHHHGINHRVATAYPEQAAMIGGARARVHNYVKALKPQKAIGLPFDSEMPDPTKERHYDDAADMAARPMSIVDHVKDGSLNPSKFRHFVHMHPEVHELLKKKMTEKMTQNQFDEGKKPPFKVRQAMSLFMGRPLEQNFTPATILAAQATFQPQQPAAPGAKGSTKELGKANSEALTPLQADTKRDVERKA